MHEELMVCLGQSGIRHISLHYGKIDSRVYSLIYYLAGGRLHPWR